VSAPASFPYGQLRQVSAQAATILADNPGVMTLEGTNTWLLRADPERDDAVVIDPGPDNDAHLAAIVAAAGRVTQILLTHGHDDHSAGAKALHELTGAPVRALDPKFRLGSQGLGEGDVIESAGVFLRVWATPGHTADSLSFLLAGRESADSDAVLTGDTVLGRGSTVIATPDGDLGAYFDSLHRLHSLGPIQVLPGHGPEIADAAAVAEAYLAHRADRLEQVSRALIDLSLEPVEASARAVVEAVYADVDQTLWEAAEMSVKAQLAYLAR
jgi:glyoxylase-like metal-dependent hydrolase (beta-lactamase superfamily II)